MILTKRKTKQSEGECEMIKKYTYGTPFPTESVTEQFAASEGMPEFGDIHLQEGFSFTYKLRDEDVVYGLGEANRGINKRGYQYISNNSDNPHHHEDVYSLYAAHNFIIVSGEQTFDFTLIIRQHSPLMSVTQDRTSFISSVKGQILICMLLQAKNHTILQSSFGR